ncbi:Uncharacterised protein [Mycobacteroides abscessus subsp. bolletii]|uniref:hypothetical protein n=1 Tax=Mycobacteroides abscessus TaxID=36809 RepID=UPI0009C96E75|nr:hypothetical protein [Mycobacteroides abscessus]SKX80456.1 Uncharacterised protein [Mycobacteroides abscessus subsp. bolletii]
MTSPMTVDQLIEKLQEHPGHAIVVVPGLDGVQWRNLGTDDPVTPLLIQPYDDVDWADWREVTDCDQINTCLRAVGIR